MRDLLLRGLSLLAASVLLTACPSAPLKPDWGRALPPGAPALLPLRPGEPWPDVASDWRRRERLLPALDRSIQWTNRPSSQKHFPIEGVSHARALASLTRFRELLVESASADDFRESLRREFTAYKSAGWNARGGGVLYTAYCTPILDGSREPSERFAHPLYALPPDLRKDEEGTVLGRETASGLQRYPTRREIERDRLLEGQGLELAWLASPLDAYIAHVNGSAVIRLPDGALFKLGYAGTNGHEYSSLRAELVRDGRLRDEEATLTGIREWARRHPEDVRAYLERNPRYVFFTPIEGNPHGSLNVEVTAERSLATDKTLFPRGAVTFVDTKGSARSTGARDFAQFMMDQDTGGAIRTAGRADIYLGIGPAAERLAGSTRAEGQLYYFFLKR